MSVSRLACVLLALVAWSTPSRGLALVIDDFSQGSLLLRSYGRPTFETTQESLDPGHTIGGVRSWRGFYHNISSPTPESYSQILLDPADAVLDFRAVDENRGSRGYFYLSYGSSESPLDADFTAGGADRLRLRFQGELSNPWLRVTVRTPRADGEGTASYGWTTPGAIYGADPVFDLPYPTDRPDLDFTRVESVELSVIRYSAGDYFQLDTIETAPTPIVGDLDRDGDVDLDDYEHWEQNKPLLRRDFNTGELVPNDFTPTNYLTDDANGDGELSAADYTVWRDAYRAMQQPRALVPEPTALLAALSAVFCVATRRRSGRVAA